MPVCVYVGVAVGETDGDGEGVGDGQPARQVVGGLPLSSMLLAFSSGCCSCVKAAQWIKVISPLPPSHRCVRYCAPSKSCC